MFGKRILLFCCLFSTISCKKEQIIVVEPNYNYTVAKNNFTVPVRVDFVNTSKGAARYKWTFDGGTPASSTQKDPGTILFHDPGAHTITLEAWNDDDRKTKMITLQLDNHVSIDFDVNVLINHFASAQVRIVNKTEGASSYRWTFEGGTPASSTSKDPGTIHFNQAGEHTITLVANNGRSDFTLKKKIVVGPSLRATFDLVPSLEDEEWHAPVKATLKNKSAGGLTWKWTSTGGKISNDTAENPDILFSEPGDYIVSLTANNGKESKTETKTITIHPNTNLLCFSNVQLGINTSNHNTFYSTKLRRGFKPTGTPNGVGKDIDIVFYGHTGNFELNRFVSPHSSGDLPHFKPIPHAQVVAIANIQKQADAGLTAFEFDQMTTGSLLERIHIGSHQPSATDSFQKGAIVLYQTQDGRKGAIKIKEFISDGQDSYILVDIKVQKNPKR